VNSDLSQHSHEVAILGALPHNERAGAATIFLKKNQISFETETP
jgi:hypothetical protein